MTKGLAAVVYIFVHTFFSVIAVIFEIYIEMLQKNHVRNCICYILSRH